MKFIKNIFGIAIVAAAALLACVPAQAQFDYFGESRTLVVTTNAVLTSAVYSNLPVDIRGSAGVGDLIISVTTNAAVGGSFAVGVFGSSDLTNWTALSNVAYGTNQAFIITNNYYAAQIKATNVYIMPGITNTPTASSAGYATPNIVYSPFTNTVSSIRMDSGGTLSLGVNVQDSPRYLSVQYTPSANNTNAAVSAVLVLKKQQ